MTAPRVSPEAQRAHDAAVKRGELGYLDPQLGLYVMTELYLKQRGHCCESGCRHCPYGFHERPH